MDELVRFLSLSELFKDIRSTDLEQLSELLEIKHMDANAPIFGEDDLGDNLYILYHGSIKIIVRAIWRMKQEEMIRIIRPGEIFGEFSFIDGCRRSASALTVEKSTVLILSKEKFDRFSIDNPAAALSVMQNFAWILTQKIRNTTMLWRSDKI